MKIIRLCFFIVFFVFLSCCYKRLTIAGNEEKASKAPSTSIGTTKRTINIPIDMEEQRKYQAAVDKGHQPWRLDPIMVSQSYCGVYKKDDISFICKEINPKKKETTVVCESDEKKFVIHLKRLVRDNGIWTITSVDIIYKRN